MLVGIESAGGLDDGIVACVVSIVGVLVAEAQSKGPLPELFKSAMDDLGGFSLVGQERRKCSMRSGCSSV